MKKEYVIPIMKFSNFNLNPYMIIVSGEDTDDSMDSKRRRRRDDFYEIENEEDDTFWH